MAPLTFGHIVCRPTERERTECLITAKLRSIMMFQDLENITSKEVCVTQQLISMCVCGKYLFLKKCYM